MNVQDLRQIYKMSIDTQEIQSYYEQLDIRERMKMIEDIDELIINERFMSMEEEKIDSIKKLLGIKRVSRREGRSLIKA